MCADGAKGKVLTMQHNHCGRIFFSIQECIFRIRRIQGKMRSTVWTVQRLTEPGKNLIRDHTHTVQTVDLILPCIRRIRKMHSCIKKKILPQWLCCIVRTFTLAPSGTHDPGIIFLLLLKLIVRLGIIFFPVKVNCTFFLWQDVIKRPTST